MLMARKAIAAALLISMVAWAELVLAPMLAMHAGHMRPGHEMAVDMPSGHAAHHHTAMDRAEPAPQRPCCPGIHESESKLAFELTAGISGCDDPHSCCFRQGPQSVPEPARDVQQLTQDVAPVMAAEVNPSPFPGKLPACDSTPTLSPPPDVFGVILRV